MKFSCAHGPLPEGRTLFPFQAQAIASMCGFLRATGGCYNACEQGLGKSIMAIVTCNVLIARKKLIICPAVMRHTWAKELSIWEAQPSAGIVVVDSSRELFSTKIAETTVVSYDLASRHSDYLSKDDWDAIVFDEAHYLKNRNAKRTQRILSALWPKARYKIALSGTPFTQSVVDGFTLFNAFAPDEFPNFWQFANRYAYKKITPWGSKFYGVRNAEELSNKIRSRFYIRFKKEEVLKELPPKTFSRISLPETFSLTPSKSEAETVKEQTAIFLKRIETGEGTSVLPASLAAQRRLQGEKKLPAVIDFVRDLLEQEIPVVVFAYHRNFISKLSEALHMFNPAVITGDTSAYERTRLVEHFQGGGTNCFIGQFTAGGVGITLTRSSTVVLGELDWSPAVVAQATDRVHRIGQKDAVTAYYFVVRDSLEEGIVETVMNKAKTFAQVVEN